MRQFVYTAERAYLVKHFFFLYISKGALFTRKWGMHKKLTPSENISQSDSLYRQCTPPNHFHKGCKCISPVDETPLLRSPSWRVDVHASTGGLLVYFVWIPLA